MDKAIGSRRRVCTIAPAGGIVAERQRIWICTPRGVADSAGYAIRALGCLFSLVNFDDDDDQWQKIFLAIAEKTEGLFTIF